MPVLTDPQIAAAVKAAGWPTDQQTTAVAVILAESSGRSDVRNSIGASGLMQILESAHRDLFRQYNWRDPVQNCKMGLSVYNAAGQSWRPWVAYTSGSYLRFMGRARTATGNPAGEIPGAVGSPETSPVGLSLTDSNSWARIGWFVAGGLLVLIGAIFLLKLENVVPMGKTLKMVRKVVK